MDRYGLTDAQWAKMEPHCLGKPTDPGRSGRNNRLFWEAVPWIVRTVRASNISARMMIGRVAADSLNPAHSPTTDRTAATERSVSWSRADRTINEITPRPKAVDHSDVLKF